VKPSPTLIWFLIGMAFLLAELALPGFILIFFTAGAWLAAIAVFLFDVDTTYQIIVFVVASLILLFTLRKYSLKTFKGTSRGEVDDVLKDTKIGQNATVTKAIAPNVPGEIKLMGSFWRAVADQEIAVDTPVVITAQASADGLTFEVKPL
jgi:inner membrane protein